MFPRPSLRTIVIGVVAAGVVLGGVIAFGNYLTPEPAPPAQLLSAADGCNRFWELMNSDKSHRTMKAEMLALSDGFDRFDRRQASRLWYFANHMPPTGLGKLDDAFYRHCVNENDWPPPTREIADMREPPERSAN